MDVKEAISKRKSIRKYLDKQIPEEIIEDLLDAARRAPSAKNTQSHKYFIVKDIVYPPRIQTITWFTSNLTNTHTYFFASF